MMNSGNGLSLGAVHASTHIQSCSLMKIKPRGKHQQITRCVACLQSHRPCDNLPRPATMHHAGNGFSRPGAMPGRQRRGRAAAGGKDVY